VGSAAQTALNVAMKTEKNSDCALKPVFVIQFNFWFRGFWLWWF
jgi:hypothetical protein